MLIGRLLAYGIVDVDRGHGLGFVVVGLYICVTDFFYKKDLLYFQQ